MAELTDLQAAQAVKLIGADSTGVESVPVNAEDASSDGLVATLFGMITKSRLLGFNGTTWDRIRTSSIGDNVAALGLAAEAAYGRYRTAVNVLSDGNYSSLGVDENGLLVTTETEKYYSLQGKVFTASLNANVTAAAETGVLLIRNPAGTGKQLRIFKTNCSVYTASSRARINFYVGPTVTTPGTVATIINHRRKVSPTASVMTAFTLPTISAFGAFMSGAVINAMGTVMDDSRTIVLEAGQDFLVTCTHSAGASPTSISVSWQEI